MESSSLAGFWDTESGHLEKAACLFPGCFEDPSSRQKKIVKGKTSLDVCGLYLGTVQREGERAIEERCLELPSHEGSVALVLARR